MAFEIRPPFESDRRRTTEDFELRLDVSDPAVDDELINIPRIDTVLRQSGDDCIEIVNSLIPRVIGSLLLLHTKKQVVDLRQARLLHHASV